MIAVAHNPYLLHQSQGWRQAVRAINESRIDGPVLIRTGLIETADTDYLTRPQYAGYLRAPLSAYPVSQTTVLLPYEDSPALRPYLNEAYSQAARHGSFVLLMLPEPGTLKTILERAKADGFHPKRIGEFESVSVWRFDKR
jgi:hypothetical protein